MNGRADLNGQRVLVVEDDWFIAGYVSDALEEAGAAVVGPVPSSDEALHLLNGDERPSAATLNVRLTDGDSVPVARRLSELGVPFLFLSATADTDLPPDLTGHPRLGKPFAAFQVVEALAGMVRPIPANGR